MAKYKPAKGSQKSKGSRNQTKDAQLTKTSALRALPCLLIVIIGIVLVSTLFYSMMKSSTP